LLLECRIGGEGRLEMHRRILLVSTDANVEQSGRCTCFYGVIGHAVSSMGLQLAGELSFCIIILASLITL